MKPVQHIILLGATILLATACAGPLPGPAAPAPAAAGLEPLPPPLEVRFSHQGRLLTHEIMGFGPANVHIHGAIHGNESESVDPARRLRDELAARPGLRAGLRVIFVNPVNPDGLAAGTRYNANGVDLNRNFPASNWRRYGNPRLGGSGPEPLSEPETRALVDLLERYPPTLVISLHSAAHCVNWDGPCRDLAGRMADLTGYRLAPSIGYPTPGSLGSFLGQDRKVPVITLELHRATPDQLWRETEKALLAALDWAATASSSPATGGRGKKGRCSPRR